MVFVKLAITSVCADISVDQTDNFTSVGAKLKPMYDVFVLIPIEPLSIVRSKKETKGIIAIQ
jgi:hypothetical protein